MSFLEYTMNPLSLVYPQQPAGVLSNPDSRFFIKRSQAKKPSRLNRNHFPAYFAYRFLVPHDVKNTKDLQFWCELAEIPTDCLKEEALRRWERWNEKFVAMKQKYGLR